MVVNFTPVSDDPCIFDVASSSSFAFLPLRGGGDYKQTPAGVCQRTFFAQLALNHTEAGFRGR